MAKTYLILPLFGAIKIAIRPGVKIVRYAHERTVKPINKYLGDHWAWYDRWHKRIFHRPVHVIVFAGYIILISSFLFFAFQRIFAAPDLTNTWDFSTPSDYTLSSGLEINGGGRMKATNYTTDANTKALFHFDEIAGTSAADDSGNSNDLTLSNTPTWTTGQLNGGLSFNGTTQYGSAADSASLSVTNANTLEAWTKFSSSFGNNTHGQNQTIADKGSYKLYYDHTSGKVTYELANSSADSWTKRAGDDLNDSWDTDGKSAVLSQVAIGTDVYAGLGSGAGDAEVWKYDGTSWTKIGGGTAINSSWNDEHETVNSLATDGTNLYAGLGSGTGDAEVWMWNGTTWTKIGGDGTGILASTFEYVLSMVYMSGNLYVGVGDDTAGDAEVYRYTISGGTWTRVGGDGVYSGWATAWEGVYSLSTDGTYVYAGLGNNNVDAEVWRCTTCGGTPSWTKIGGDGVNSSWASVYNVVRSMTYMGSQLYVGLGDDAGEAEVWTCTSCSGTPTWSKIGGDAVNSSWADATYEQVQSLANDGTNIYAGIGTGSGEGEVWKWNGSAWSQIGGDGLNSGWTGGINQHSLLYANSKLYATATVANLWTFNGSAWTQVGGQYINQSWGAGSITSAYSMTSHNGKLYAGATGSSGAGTVWEYDGSDWLIIGGQDIKSSWAANTYSTVFSMISYKGSLYAGIGGSSDGTAEVWKYNGSTWTQVGGDGVGSSWSTGTGVYSLATSGGNLYAGLAGAAGNSDVWSYDGSTWTQIGGDGLNSGWSTPTIVYALTVYNGDLYAGLGGNTDYDEVWKYNGSTWAKVGGDGLNSGWTTSTWQWGVNALSVYKGELYATVYGVVATLDDAEIWKYNGSTWTQVGGDGVGSSWAGGSYEAAYGLTEYNGDLYAGLGTSVEEGEVWKYNGSTWSQIGGDSLNSGWATEDQTQTVRSLAVYNGKLYAGLGDTQDKAEVWSYGDNDVLQSATASQDTNWHHIAATYDGFTMKLYIDGTLDASQAASGSLPDNSQSLRIGSGFGAPNLGVSDGYFAGSLDEVRISNTARSSFTTAPYSSDPQTVTLGAAVRTSGVWHWDTWADSETANGGTITYRLSTDGGTTWLYWGGAAWDTSDNTSESNSVSVINDHMSTLPVTFDGLVWQAVLDGDGTQRVTLNSITAEATSDVVEPSPNASSITALKAAGGASLSSGGWTNGSSPYFSWTAGSDADSGVKGYCLYLGQDDTADPTTTKGLLGTGPLDVGGNCQFAVSTTNVDLATAGYMGTAMTTSNSSYYLTIKTIDNAGNITAGAAQFSFKFDNTAPVNPTYISAPSGFLSSKDVTMTWPTSGGGAASDANSGVAGLQYKIGATTWYGDSHSGSGDINDLLTDDGSYTTADPPDYDNLAEGNNTVYFRTWDQAGNVTTSYVTAGIKLNTAGTPSEPQNLVATPSTNTSNSFAFSWDAPATYNGSENNIVYCYTVNTTPSSGTCTWTQPGITSLAAAAYATQPGSNTFYVVAKDEFGNVNYATYTSVAFTANTTAPGIPLNIAISDVSIRSTSNWRLAITWEIPTSVGSGVNSYKVYRSTDGSSYSQVGSSSSPSYVDGSLSQQLYYYKIRACDSTNNCGADSSVASATPTGKYTSAATLVSGPSVSGITTRKATVNWSTDRVSDSRIAYGVQSGQYGSAEIAVAAQVTSHEIDFNNLSAGTNYYFKVKWTDVDGNVGTSQEYTFRTDEAPSLKEVTTKSVTLNDAVIQFTSKSASKVSVLYGKTDSFGAIKTINTAETESTYTVNLTGLEDGNKYYYKLVSYDNEGFSYDGSIFAFNTPARPHITNLRFQPIKGEPTSTQKVTWNTNVPSSSSVTYGVVGTEGKGIEEPKMVTEHEITIRALRDDTEYFLIARSQDANGVVATSDKQIFKTALDTRPPKISDVTVETSIRGNGADARSQIIVSWHTDEPATSQVGYAEGINAAKLINKTAEDAALSTEHIVIVSGLPTSRVYSVAPISKDNADNQTIGSAQSAIVGRASDSVLTIVLDALKKVFGF